MNESDPRLFLLNSLSKEQLVRLVVRLGACFDHLEKVIASTGYSQCHTCGLVESSHCLDLIDGLTQRFVGNGNDMDSYLYSVDYDPHGVVVRLEEILKRSLPPSSSI